MAFSPRYDHNDAETRMYALWESNQSFAPASDSDPSVAGESNTFTIMMPPPNANDPLHVGHAMFISIEDLLIRYHRMLGDDTLWLPGTDHAGIETQYVFEKKLRKKGKSRFDFNRESLYDKIFSYVEENSDVAVNQMKKIGASADWSRFTFMLDDDIVDTVLETFEQLHRDDLLYRDSRLVNYCTKCGTGYSDLEVEHEETTSQLYYLQYGPFEVATTRPETMFGDVAIAVHPDDKRYLEYVGDTIEVELPHTTLELKVIADEAVDPEFGSGAVKVTPLHDETDFQIWKRHEAELAKPEAVISFDGKLTELAGPLTGSSLYANPTAREKTVELLDEQGLLNRVEKGYQNRVGHCYRCDRVIEPLPLPQFYISMKDLAAPVLNGLDANDITIHGAGHDKILRHWLENIKDWNISRQIVWGIRIPVWYRVQGNEDKIRAGFIPNAGTEDQGRFTEGRLDELLQDYDLDTIRGGLQTLNVSAEVEDYLISRTDPSLDPDRQETGEWLQETDTFDTWFSSAQWPFSTLMAQSRRNPADNDIDDFEHFYPTDVMNTGYDILPFWVMRMLMMGKYRTGDFPFKDVYLHGLVRDEQGDKMSKSKGNVINPLEVIEEYGADALRMALVIRSSAGLDKSVGNRDFKAMRNFSNKIWNAARFISLMLTDDEYELPDTTDSATDNSTAFRKELSETIQKVTKQLDDFKLGLAADTVYNAFWHDFCDLRIEQTKSGKLPPEDLAHGLETYLKLLHPFVPFVTEAIWQELREDLGFDDELLISASWPVTRE